MFYEESHRDAKLFRPLMKVIFAGLVAVASLGVAGAAVTTTYINPKMR